MSRPKTFLGYTRTSHSSKHYTDEALAGDWGYRLLEPYMVYNESDTTPNNYDPWFPGCPVFDNLNKVASFGCNFIRLNKDGKSLPLDFFQIPIIHFRAIALLFLIIYIFP